jgi:SpoVK/Ycf46/Vps4 family AAA+-type ATPase
MASSEQIKALIKSHSEGDDARFYSIAMQMAAQAARQGHSKLADELRVLIDEVKEHQAKRLKNSPIAHLNQPRGELVGLLSVSYPKERLSHIILPKETLSRLERVILEQRQKSKLIEHDLNPRRKILLLGPPGTGKTLSASVLAGELHLPLYMILLDGLITKYMGETASKLRLIFENIDRIRGVYFFDEFDAIGTCRTSQNDVGEIRRVLNSFLQFLEQSNSDSVIIAATNNPELLDKALYRRFDDVIEYQLPDEMLAIQTFKNRLSLVGIKNFDWNKLSDASKGLSFAEICNACDDAIKTIVLDETKGDLTTDIVLDSIKERFASKK